MPPTSKIVKFCDNLSKLLLIESEMPSYQLGADKLQDTVEAFQKLLAPPSTSEQTTRHAEQPLALIADDLKKANVTG